MFDDFSTPPENSKPSALFDQMMNRIRSEKTNKQYDVDPNLDPLSQIEQFKQVIETLRTDNETLQDENKRLHALLVGKRTAESNVYIMTADNREYKIGISSNPEHRKTEIAHFMRVESTALRIVYQVPAHRKLAYKVEQQLHREFKEQRIHREWFVLSEVDLQKAITRCAELIAKM